MSDAHNSGRQASALSAEDTQRIELYLAQCDGYVGSRGLRPAHDYMTTEQPNPNLVGHMCPSCEEAYLTDPLECFTDLPKKSKAPTIGQLERKLQTR